MVEYTDINKSGSSSPSYPLKEKATLLADHHRLAMANIAVEDDPRFRASNIEFHLPQPSYTVDTLAYLSEKYPDKEFLLICGSDNLPSFSKWKITRIAEPVSSLSIPAGTQSNPFDDHRISISHKRRRLRSLPVLSARASKMEKTSASFYLKGLEYITEMHFYE